MNKNTRLVDGAIGLALIILGHKILTDALQNKNK